MLFRGEWAEATMTSLKVAVPQAHGRQEPRGAFNRPFSMWRKSS